MNNIYPMFYLLFFLTGCSHFSNDSFKLTMIQTTDRNGISETISSEERLKKIEKNNFLSPQPYQKVLRIYKKKNQDESFSFLTSYYPNGNLFQYLEILNARAHGAYKELHSNGEKKIDATVIGGPPDLSQSAQQEWLFDGKCQAFNERGSILSEINYSRGFLNGEAKYYYPSGQIFKTCLFINNLKEGEEKEYHENGQLKAKLSYKKGKKEGPAFEYWEKEKLCAIEEYSDDRLLEGEYFNYFNALIGKIKNGEGKKPIFKENYLHKLVEYQKGIPEGLVETFFPDGQIQTRCIIKNGKKNGEEVNFYLSETIHEKNLPTPKFSISWQDGIVQGLMKTYYPNGQLETQKMICRNKKEGPASAWYPDGSLMFIEEYENDLLMLGRYYKIKDPVPISQIDHGKGTATIFTEKGDFIRKIPYEHGVPQE